MTLLRIVLALFLAFASWGGALADDPPRQVLSSAKNKIDDVEAALQRPNIDEDTLVKLRNDLDGPRSALIVLQADMTSQRDAAKVRLDKLGPPPKDGDPPEIAEVTASRARESGTFSELDSVAKEAQLQVTRADQIATRIGDMRRLGFARQLSKRDSSVLDPNFWIRAGGDVPRTAYVIGLMWRDAGLAAWKAGALQIGLALLSILVGAVLARLARARLALFMDRLAQTKRAPRRFVAASMVLLDIVHAVLGLPMLVIILYASISGFELASEKFVDTFPAALIDSILTATIFDAMGRGILADGRPDLRLLPLSNWAVRRIRRRTRWIAIILGTFSLLDFICQAVFAPPSLTTAIAAGQAFGIAIITISLLVRLREAPPTPGVVEGAPDTNPLDFLRPILWVIDLAIIGCLLMGFIKLAEGIAGITLVLLFIASFVFVLITLIDSGLTDGLAGDGPRSRTIAGVIGVSPKNVAFAATLLSGVLRLLLIGGSAALLAGPMGFYSADMFSALERAFFGFQIGEITISPSSILLALALFIGVVGLTRLIVAWVRNTLLPRTTMDAGLQNSVTTVIGYIGGVLAVVIALSEVGLDLQNIAIVAGALSVGIGFGLQSIVSNFVSGLILLAERPVRVGDIISVKNGEEGYVRRISVRATEIETYDRATLIVPNSELITGVVKNWIYGNSWARTRIIVKVGYDSDIDLVEKAMIGAVADDPRILPSPRPRVFLSQLGETAMEFELTAVIASVETGPAVKSDLQKRIVKAFREAGIRMAAQLPAVPPPVVVSLDEALAAVHKPVLDSPE